MSCWTCGCGKRNCDTDVCLDPRCESHHGITINEAIMRLENAGLDRSDLREVPKIHGHLYDARVLKELCE